MEERTAHLKAWEQMAENGQTMMAEKLRKMLLEHTKRIKTGKLDIDEYEGS